MDYPNFVLLKIVLKMIAGKKPIEYKTSKQFKSVNIETLSNYQLILPILTTAVVTAEYINVFRMILS